MTLLGLEAGCTGGLARERCKSWRDSTAAEIGLLVSLAGDSVRDTTSFCASYQTLKPLSSAKVRAYHLRVIRSFMISYLRSKAEVLGSTSRQAMT